MERINALIDKIYQQKEQGISPAQILPNVQLLQSEIVKLQQKNGVLGTSKVAVIMPVHSNYHATELPVAEIETIVKLFNAKLEIFYVGRNENIINRNALNNLLLNHRLEHLKPKYYYVEDDNVWRGITELAEKHAIDMLMVLSKKHGPFHKSQTKDFVFYSNVPVMVIHENDLDAKS